MLAISLDGEVLEQVIAVSVSRFCLVNGVSILHLQRYNDLADSNPRLGRDIVFHPKPAPRYFIQRHLLHRRGGQVRTSG